MKLFFIIIFSINFYKVLLDDNCNECIRKSERHVWCAKDNFATARCIRKKDINNEWCSNEIIDPESKIDTITKNFPFSSIVDKTVQLRPQEINADIRIGHAVKIDFFYKKATKYPVDLYFLFDASTSMEKYKANLINQSDEIYTVLRGMTDNVYLGIGSFIDKNAIPFASEYNEDQTYSFKPMLKLTDNAIEFKNTVNKMTFGINYDDPEGTLDALAQAVVCKEIVGWRKDSTKMIVVLTDQSCHVAGEGLEAGIIRPYDGTCYMKDGKYTKELEMDYPSIYTIKKIVENDQVQIIFFVDPAQENFYNTLRKTISGSVVSTDITQLTKRIKDKYKAITGEIKLKINTEPPGLQKYFDLKFSPDCTKAKKKECTVKQDEEKHISVNLVLKEFIKHDKINLDISVEGITEKVRLRLKIKECDCLTETKSSFCSFSGTKRCGICECDDRFSGKHCECSATKKTINSNNCLAWGSQEACMSRGLCVCGSCVCNEGYNGNYCQYDLKSCQHGDDGICSNHGKCEQGVCNCDAGWKDEFCSCSTSTVSCFEKDIECSNRGSCDCGRCKCNAIPLWDARTEQDEKCKILQSQDQNTCHQRQCQLLESCAHCFFESTGCSTCPYINATVVNTLPTSNVSDGIWRECVINVGVSCYTKFKYRYNDILNKVDMVVQSDSNCAETYYKIGGGCLLGLVLIGVATLLIWKYITDRRDRREYEQFLKEIQGADVIVENHIFEPALTTFENPTFRRRSIPNL